MPLTKELINATTTGPLRPLTAADLQFEDNNPEQCTDKCEEDEWLKALRSWQVAAECTMYDISTYPSGHWYQGQRHNFLVWIWPPLDNNDASRLHVAAFPTDIQPKDARPETSIAKAEVCWTRPAPANDC